MADELSIKLNMAPDLDLSKLRSMLATLKSSLEKLGKDTQLIDADKMQAEVSRVNAQINTMKDAVEKASSSAAKLRSELSAPASSSGNAEAARYDELTEKIKKAETAMSSLAAQAKKMEVAGDTGEEYAKLKKNIESAEKELKDLKSEAQGAKTALSGIDQGAEGLANNIKDAADEMKKLENEAEGAKKSVDKIGDGAKGSLSGVGKEAEKAGGSLKGFLGNAASMAGGMLMANGITAAVSGVKEMVSAGAEFQASMADFSALTGVQGKALDDFGLKARELAKEFGGTAKDQIESFKGVLSKFGPDLAKSPEALNSMAKSINTLAVAGGMDATQAMDALTASALQFNVSMADPKKGAAELARMMNVLAAGAKEGAAEIPDVAEAVKAAGVAASGAKLSFEETNAALQVLASGGKNGAEAGNALRNVLGLLQNTSSTGEKAMNKLGTSSAELGQILTTKGVGAAMQKLKEGMDKLSTPTEKNVALMDIFQTENASAAGIMIQNADSIGELTKKITGTNTAYDQAATNMATFTKQFEKLKTNLADVGLDIFKAIEKPLQQMFTTLSTSVMPAIGKLGEALAPAFTSIVGTLGEALGQILPVFTDIIKDVVPVFSPLMDVVKGLVPVIKSVMTAIQPIWKALADAVGQILPALVPMMKPVADILGVVGRLLSAVITPVLKALGPAIFSLLEGLTPVIEIVARLLELLEPLLWVILQPLIWILQAIIKPINDTGIALKWLGNAFLDVGGFIKDVVNSIGGFITKILQFLGIVEKKPLKAPLNPNYGKDMKQAGKDTQDAGAAITGAVQGVQAELGKQDGKTNSGIGGAAKKAKADKVSILKDYDELVKGLARTADAQAKADAKMRADQGRSSNVYDEIAANERKRKQLEEQSKALDDIKKKYDVVLDQDGKIVKISAKVDEKDKDRLQQEIDKLANEISENETSTVVLQTTLKVDRAEFERVKEEAYREDLKMKISLGYAVPGDMMSLLQGDLQKLNEERNKTQAQFDKAATDAEKFELEKKLFAIDQKIKKANQDILDEKKRVSDEAIKILEDQYDKEAKLLEDKNQKELDFWNRMADGSVQTMSVNVDKKFEADVSELDDAKAKELITEDQYNKQKEALEKEHQARLLAISYAGEGMRRESQRQADVEALTLQKDKLEKQLALVDKETDPAKYEELSKKLGETKDALAEKGDIMKAYAGDLQASLTDSLQNLFDGDFEKMKEPFKKLFATISGVLKAEASAAMAKMVIDYLFQDQSPWYIKLLAIPAIKALSSGAINAILGPVLNSIASFSTGTRVDEPTLAIIGDASKSRPGKDTEWILRDDQIWLIVSNALKVYTEDMKRVVKEFSDAIIEGLSVGIDGALTRTQKIQLNEFGERFFKVPADVLFQKVSESILERQIEITRESESAKKAMAESDIPTNELPNEAALERIAMLLRDMNKTIANARPEYRILLTTPAIVQTLAEQGERLSVLEAQLVNNEISQDEYLDATRRIKMRVQSFADGSPMLYEPQLAVVGDSADGKPEKVFNYKEIRELVTGTVDISNARLEGRIDTMIGLMRQFVEKPTEVSLDGQKLTDEINRINNRKKYG